MAARRPLHAIAGRRFDPRAVEQFRPKAKWSAGIEANSAEREQRENSPATAPRVARPSSYHDVMQAAQPRIVRRQRVDDERMRGAGLMVAVAAVLVVVPIRRARAGHANERLKTAAEHFRKSRSSITIAVARLPSGIINECPARLNIGCFGGGTGMPSVLGGLKNNPWLRVTRRDLFDSGGGSGQLRGQLGVLPPGDILGARSRSRNTREAQRVLLARLPTLEHARLGGHTGVTCCSR
jgi:hypothetical protein